MTAPQPPQPPGSERGSGSGSARPLSVDEASQRVRAGGGRLTRARRLLLDDLYRSGDRITAEDLATRHDDVDLATVYRSLAYFEEVGVVEHVHLGHGPAAYRWAGARTIAAVCERCGAVTDVPVGELDDLSDRLRSSYGLVLSLGHFALSVRCSSCA